MFYRYCLIILTFFSFQQVQAQSPPAVYPSSFTVAQDGSGDFVTIQEAVNAVRDLSQQQVTIFIKKGIYKEKLVIPSWKIRISLVGEDREQTIITNNDYSGKTYTAFANGKDAFGKTQFSTYTSYTVLVQGRDCILKNLTIANTSGRVGQAVALHVEGDRVAVYNCSLTGNQDTLYTATENSRQYYADCSIEGTTDFIFGQATAVFQHCTIRSLQDSYITAASTSAGQQYGYVFIDCKLTADSAAKKVYLGRPWRPHAKTVFISTQMDGHIRPEGWDNWRSTENEKTVFYAEYNSTGAGAYTAKRVRWSKQLSVKAVKAYTIANILGGADHWQPAAVFTK